LAAVKGIVGELSGQGVISASGVVTGTLSSAAPISASPGTRWDGVDEEQDHRQRGVDAALTGRPAA
jgi:hypothetical protein